MAKADYFVVLEAFLVGGELYQKGEIVDATDPAYRKSPHLFGPLVIRGQGPVVEQATAAPGEQRQGKALTSAGLRGRN